MQTASPWSHFNPVRIVFGPGSLAQLGGLMPGGRVLLLTSAGFAARGTAGEIVALLAPRHVTRCERIEPNPDLNALDAIAADLAGAKIDSIVALGGGSVLDAGKALSVALAAESGWTLRAHLAGELSLPTREPLPLIAIPTTAGTGSEVTPFATIWDHTARKKLSLASPRLYARIALLDPLLTVALPQETTVSCGLDALSQGFEAIWNRNATPVSTAFATAAIVRALAALPALPEVPDDVSLRGAMLEASLLAGLAISQSRTAMAHSISYPLTAHFGLPHGLACSFTLPALLEFNAAEDDGRLLSLARALGEPSAASLVTRLRTLLDRLGVGDLLRRYLPSRDAVLRLTPEMFTPGRADNNLRAVAPAQLAAIVRTSLPTPLSLAQPPV